MLITFLFVHLKKKFFFVTETFFQVFVKLERLTSSMEKYTFTEHTKMITLYNFGK